MHITHFNEEIISYLEALRKNAARCIQAVSPAKMRRYFFYDSNPGNHGCVTWKRRNYASLLAVLKKGETAFLNKTIPVNTIIADNHWEFTVDLQALVESRISVRNAEITAESSANPASIP